MKLHQAMASVKSPVLIAVTQNQKKVEISSYKDDQKAIMVNASVMPYSPYSGRFLTPVNSKVRVSLNPDDLKGMVTIAHCANCDKNFKTLASIAEKLDNKFKMFCMVCSEAMEVDLEFDNENFNETPDELEAMEDEMDNYEEIVEPPVSDDFISTIENPSIEDHEIEDEEEIDFNDSLETPEESEAIDESIEELTEEPDVDTEGTSLEVNMTDDVDFSNPDTRIDLIPSTSAIISFYVMANGKPVATLDRSKASQQVQNLFNDGSKLYSALSAALKSKKNISKEVSQAFGLRVIKHKFKITSAVKNLIREKIEAENEKARNSIAEFTSSFKQCASIAALGLIKGHLGSNNIFKDTLAAKLTRAGILDAQETATEILLASSVPFLQEVFEETSKLLKEPVVARNAMARVIENAGYNNPPKNSPASISSELASGNIGGFIPAVTSTASKKEVKNSVALAASLFRKG